MTFARKRKEWKGPAYSTDPAPPINHPRPKADPGLPTHQQTARISRESKGHKGKTVTLVSGLVHDPARMEALLKELKQACGAGGTLREGTIEIQGDQRERVAEELRRRGYKVKMAGG